MLTWSNYRSAYNLVNTRVVNLKTNFVSCLQGCINFVNTTKLAILTSLILANNLKKLTISLLVTKVKLTNNEVVSKSVNSIEFTAKNNEVVLS